MSAKQNHRAKHLSVLAGCAELFQKRFGAWGLAAVFLSLILVGCAEMFQEKIAFDADGDYMAEGLSGMFAKEDEGKLKTPQDLRASISQTSGQIYLSWQPVSGALTYRVERAVVSPDGEGVFPEELPDDGDYVVLNANLYNSTGYVDNILGNPSASAPEYKNRYYYRVQALNARTGREESDFASGKYGTLFSVPTKVDADKGKSVDEIKVRWEKVENASSYNIYRTQNEDGTGAILRDRKYDTLYVDKLSGNEQGTNFYYIIVAVNEQNIESAKSVPAPGYSLIKGAPGEVQNVKVKSRAVSPGEAIEISWEELSGVDGELNYFIYRTSSVDAKYRKVGEVPGTTTTFSDRQALEKGVYYYYQIQPRATKNGDELKGPYSNVEAKNEYGDIVCEGFVLSPPMELNVSKSGNTSTLKWLMAIGSEDEQSKYSYVISASSNKDTGFADIATVTPDMWGRSGEYLTYDIVGDHKFFKIKTHFNGRSSAESEVTAPSPLAATGVSVSRAENLGEIYGANSSGVYPVRIKWQKPANDEPNGYHIYRSTRSNGGFKRITTSPVLSTDELSYVDTDPDNSMKAGKYYYYKVLALNELNQGSNYSEVQSGYGALTHNQFLIEFNKTIKSSHKKLTYMNRPGSTDKLGTETKSGAVSGTVYYNAQIAGLGARIIMTYTNYADSTVEEEQFVNDNVSKNKVPYFVLNGNSNTSANMSSNGTMDGTINISGMYSGSVGYGSIQIKGGQAGGGTYRVSVQGFSAKDVAYSVIN